MTDYTHLQGSVVLVKWRDIAGHSGWKDQSEVDELKPWEFQTVSLLVKAEPYFIVLADTWDDADNDLTYGGVNVIPTGCIDSITVVPNVI